MGCSCGNDVVDDPKGYQCIDGELVCYPNEGDDSYEKIIHQQCKNAAVHECSCGNEKIPVGAVCKNKQLCKACSHPFGIKQDHYFTKTCDFNGNKLDIQYKYQYQSEYDGGTSYFVSDASESINCDYIDYMDPCDCLKSLSKADIEPKQEIISNYYCAISLEDNRAFRSDYPDEFAEGWYRFDPNNEETVCQKAQTIGMVNPQLMGDPVIAKVVYHADNNTCQCGDSEVPVAEVNDYICDMNLHWRCNREDGCACGDVRCKQSQIWSSPGVCSQ